MIEKIGILTSGGDSQGMNAAIVGIIKTANSKKIKTYIIRDGFFGIVNNLIEIVDHNFVNNIINLGGTVIGSVRYPEFKEYKIREKAVFNLKKLNITTLIIIGGNGSYKGAQCLVEMGINCITLPGTIDNDIYSSDYTIGFDSAINIVVEAIDRLRDTMQSHNRCSILEVMGHSCGDIALYAGIAGGADIISINNFPLSEEKIIERVKNLYEAKKRSVIIVVSEMIYPDIHKLAKLIEIKSGYITRATVLGHLQRGGKPTAMDRYFAFQMACFAVEQIIKGKIGLAINNKCGKIVTETIKNSLNTKHLSKKEILNKFDEINKNIYKK